MSPSDCLQSLGFAALSVGFCQELTLKCAAKTTAAVHGKPTVPDERRAVTFLARASENDWAIPAARDRQGSFWALVENA